MRHTPALLAAAALLLLAPLAAAQQTFTSLAGPWWFTIGGKDKGSIVLEFTEPTAGSFTVKDVELTGNPSFGFAQSLADFFQIPEGESLGFDPNRNIVGDLTLDLEGGGTATLSILKGKPDKTFTTMKMKATLDGVPVKLKGVRPPAAFPVLTGRTTAGNLEGKGVKSKAMDLRVGTSTVLGPPAYEWGADGPAKTPDDPNAATSFAGRVMITPGFKAYGLLDASDPDFGDGLVSGKLRLPDPNSPVPKFSVKAAATDPKLTLKGNLTQAIEPILSVTPNTFDFGGIALDDPNGLTKTFLVQNVGVGELSGAVTLLSGSALDFSVEGDDTYGPLDPNSTPAEIVIAFHPSSAGAKSAQFRFGVDSGPGSVVVPVTGTGGVAAITVDPDPILFPDTSVNAAIVFRTITLTNSGDGTLTGVATIQNQTPAAVFTLHALNLDTPVLSIFYSLTPGNSTQFRVGFDPAAAVNYTALLGLSGAGPTAIDIKGLGTSP
ncbi:MAG TPA: choice-of-anchor D domain-containing protein [Burkholderiales bacterium]|nr:choice-of-anchor D domain-containing protein [Burkholderiales bacterium]